MKIKLKKIEQGVCPYCGSSDIEYGASEPYDDMMECYPADCNDCHRHFEEWYKLSFVGHNVGDSCEITTNDGDEEGFEIEMED